MRFSRLSALVAVGALLTNVPGAVGTSATAESAPPWAPEITSATLLRGDSEFHFWITQGASPAGIDIVDYVLLSVQAMCLWNPSQFPSPWGISTSPDELFAKHVAAADAHLLELATKLRPQHVADPDYQGPPNGPGWSSSLETSLTAELRRFLSAQHFFEYVWAAFQRESVNATSCLNLALPHVLEAIKAKSAPVKLPVDRQWKAVLSICNGSPDGVRDHISVRLGHPAVDAARAEAIRGLIEEGWFMPCLVMAIESDAKLAAKVKQLNTVNAYDAVEATKAAVHARWLELGVPRAVELMLERGKQGDQVSALQKTCETMAAAGKKESGSK